MCIFHSNIVILLKLQNAKEYFLFFLVNAKSNFIFNFFSIATLNGQSDRLHYRRRIISILASFPHGLKCASLLPSNFCSNCFYILLLS